MIHFSEFNCVVGSKVVEIIMYAMVPPDIVYAYRMCTAPLMYSSVYSKVNSSSSRTPMKLVIPQYDTSRICPRQ